MKTQKRGIAWTIIAALICILQLVAEVVIAVSLFKLGMLPQMYLIVIVIAFAAASVLTALLLLLPAKSSADGTIRIPVARRVIGVILAVLIVGICAYGYTVLSKLYTTMKEITKPTAVTGSSFAVYVLADDSAQSLEDVKEYTFGIADSFDASTLYKSVETIEKELGQNIKTTNSESVTEMVDALYNKEVSAIILSESYVDILEDEEAYQDFSEKTRVLYEVVLSEEASDETEPVRENPYVKTAITQEPFIFYFSGSDTRSKMLNVSRSDVNILIVVNPVTKQILLVNTPRDYYVPNPAGGGSLDKLTHCGIYGIDCSIEALSDLYEEQINYYAQINFTGFETVIDAIGGIDVYSDVSFTTLHGSCQIQKGMNHLNGEQALGFARERYSLASGDNDRGKNQMKVITAVIEQISAGKIVSNYTQIMDSLQGMFITDMTSDQISELVKMQLSDMAKWDVHSYAVTGKGGRAHTYSMPKSSLYVAYPNQDSVDKAVDLIDRVMNGETLTDEDVK